MNVRASAATDIGLIRQENEDSFLCSAKLGVFAVADGIGGLPGGAEASRSALHFFEHWFVEQRSGKAADYANGLQLANEQVYFLGREMSPRYGIGTTLTLAHLVGKTLHVVHVGDSFLFQIRSGKAEALTTEHNLENEMKARAARGEPVLPMAENRAALTRCVGQPPPLLGDITKHSVSAGDRYVVCTDGVTRCISPDEIAALVAAAQEPADVANHLVQLASERGGFDNATAVVVFID